MGINPYYSQFLGEAVSDGAHLGDCLTIGRLNLYLRPSDRNRILGHHGKTAPATEAEADWRYAEPFLQALGADTVQSLDISDYEGATVLHDLNQPLPDSQHGRFDSVCEGGTLEHVFWFPEALRSCMSLIKVGGDLFLNSPANNLGGHGMFQISPDLYFRALSPENGFEVKRMVLQETTHLGRRYEVTDPLQIRGRVEFQGNFSPTCLFVWARRVEDKPIFATPPLQTDYVLAWEVGPSAEPEAVVVQDRTGPKKMLDHVERHAPGLMRLYHQVMARRRNAAAFAPERQPHKFHRR